MTPTREPLAIRAAIVAAVTAVLHVLVLLGVLPIDASQEAAIAGAVDLVGLAVAVVWGRSAVTPVADPQVPGYEPRHAEPSLDEIAFSEDDLPQA